MYGKQLTVVFTALIMATAFHNCKAEGHGNDACQLPQKFIYSGPVPEFDSRVFEARRQRLTDRMQGEVAIISAATGNDFLYLTGLAREREAIAVLDKTGGNPFTLFLMPRDPMTTLWDGERTGIEGAIEKYGADAAFPESEFNERITEMMAGKKSLSFHPGDRALQESIRGLFGEKSAMTGDNGLEPLLHEMRVVKDEWEAGQLKKAIEVTNLAHRRVLQTVAPGQKEYDVQAEIEYVFRKNGLTTGFSSIVGSGPNAAILHYRDNDRRMEKGDLLLMDVGASCSGYVADVTRTIPVGGKFTPEQADLYSLVLKANQEAIKKMVPGNRILDCHHRATQIMTQGLYEIGLITDTTSWWQKRFYIQYRNNHYIGLHVHDVGSYGDFDAPDRDSYMLDPEIRGRELLPGMVMTIEPGIYLIEDRLEHLHGLFGDKATAEELDAFAEKVRPVYEKYSGIGIRIEDDVLITAEGNEVLSKNAPKTIGEIEAAMRRQ